MPNRIIKESIKSSDQIDQLSWFEEVLFYRLIVSADDYGCFDGRPIYIKNALFPTKDDVTKKAVEDAIQRMVSVGLLQRYEVNGMPYLLFPTWEKHQRIRNKHSKFPLPSIDGQLTANRGQLTAGCQSESESNPNPNIESESEEEANASCTEPKPVSAPPVITLPLNDGSEYPVSQEQCQEWAGLYPAVDVIQQLRGMRGWLLSNPKKRKTARGIERFINTWLSKEQDRGGPGWGRGGVSTSSDAMSELAQLHEMLGGDGP